VTTIRFDGQVAIVTGAARGLGRAYARELASRGAKVVVNDANLEITGRAPEIDPDETPAKVVDEIRGAGGTAVASTESVVAEQGAARIVDRALDEWGRVDVVVNNAGTLRQAPLELWTVDDVRAMLDTHVIGAFNVTKPAYTAMRTQGYGRFLFIGSSAAVWGNRVQIGYSAAKGGALGLAKTVAIEGAEFGIHANVLQPVAWTRMAGKESSAINGWLDNPESVSDEDQKISDAIGPLRSRTEPEYAAPLAVYLCSRACDLNGLVFSGAAGRYARVNIAFDDGWQASFDAPPTVEEIAEHLGEINRSTNLVEPLSTMHELFEIVRGRPAAAR
jgi:NAD(P)-dependent dehydrogenase (short-subunit alcohol dehydrogenase family)